MGIDIATLVRRALVAVCTVAVLLVLKMYSCKTPCGNRTGLGLAVAGKGLERELRLRERDGSERRHGSGTGVGP